MGVGREGRGAFPPWTLKVLEKKVVFLVFSGKKQISPLLASPGKNFEKSPSGPPWKKSFRRPCTQVYVKVVRCLRQSCLKTKLAIVG